MASPRPEPTALKKLKGNPGKRTLNKNEPKPTTTIPECPAWMPPAGRIAWNILAPELNRIGVLTSIDINSFSRYCQNLADWEACRAFLAANGPDLVTRNEDGEVTGVVPYPQTKRKRDIETFLMRYEQEFGLTPSSRSKVQAVMADQEDDLEALLSTPMKLAQ